jgi:hypothetical protein
MLILAVSVAEALLAATNKAKMKMQHARIVTLFFIVSSINNHGLDNKKHFQVTENALLV